MHILDEICESLASGKKTVSEICEELEISEQELNKILTFFKEFGLIEVEHTNIKPTENMSKFLKLPVS